MCILELSKIPIISKLGVIISDTDSFVYETETGNVFEDFSKNKEMFDFSNFSAKCQYIRKI